MILFHGGEWYSDNKKLKIQNPYDFVDHLMYLVVYSEHFIYYRNHNMVYLIVQQVMNNINTCIYKNMERNINMACCRFIYYKWPIDGLISNHDPQPYLEIKWTVRQIKLPNVKLSRKLKQRFPVQDRAAATKWVPVRVDRMTWPPPQSRNIAPSGLFSLSFPSSSLWRYNWKQGWI